MLILITIENFSFQAAFFVGVILIKFSPKLKISGSHRYCKMIKWTFLLTVFANISLEMHIWRGSSLLLALFCFDTKVSPVTVFLLPYFCNYFFLMNHTPTMNGFHRNHKPTINGFLRYHEPSINGFLRYTHSIYGT